MVLMDCKSHQSATITAKRIYAIVICVKIGVITGRTFLHRFNWIIGGLEAFTYFVLIYDFHRSFGKKLDRLDI